MTLKAPKSTNLLATLGLTSALLLTPGLAVSAQHAGHDHVAHQHAATPDFAKAALNRAQATAATTDFISAHKAWAQARGASNKAQALNNLISKAEARRDMLAELMKTNPAEALRIAIPEDKQVGMPAEVLAMLEQTVEIEGEYEARFEDYSDGSYKLRQFVKTSFGERFELHMNGKRPELGTGARIRAQGLLLANDEQATTDGEIALASDEGSLQNLAYDGSTLESSSVSFPSETFGEQRTLVMLVNFPG